MININDRHIFYDKIKKQKSIAKTRHVKGPAHSKNENLYFLAPAQTKRMQPILVSCEAPFRSNLQKNTGPVRVMTLKLTIIFFICPSFTT